MILSRGVVVLKTSGRSWPQGTPPLGGGEPYRGAGRWEHGLWILELMKARRLALERQAKKAKIGATKRERYGDACHVPSYHYQTALAASM